MKDVLAVMFLIGAIFSWVGLLFKKSWGALVAAILYSVGTLFFLAYFMFGVPLLILGFIVYVVCITSTVKLDDNKLIDFESKYLKLFEGYIIAMTQRETRSFRGKTL